MRRAPLCVLSLLSLLSLRPAAAAQPVVIRGATVIDVARGVAVPRQSVVIDGRRIRAVGPAASTPVPRGARVVDGAGKFVIPGLWDMHVHPIDRALDLPLFLAHGVTGVRVMGGTSDYPPPGHWGVAFDSVRRWRREIAAGTLVGPRIVASGLALDGPEPAWPRTLSLASPDAARRAVDSLKREGVDFVKIHTRLPREIFLAVADAARRAGLPVAGPLPEAVSVEEAAAGMRSLEHVLFDRYVYDTVFDPARLERLRGARLPPDERGAQVQRWLASFDSAALAPVAWAMSRRGAWLVPTLVVHRVEFAAGHGRMDSSAAMRARLGLVPAHVRRDWEERGATRLPGPALQAQRDVRWRNIVTATRMMHRLGVPMLAGADPWSPYIVPGESLHDELELLVQSGLSSLDALRAATSGPARFLGAADSLGAVAAGMAADLVVLDANPLDDIRHVRRVHAVVANGALLDRRRLDEMLVRARARARPGS